MGGRALKNDIYYHTDNGQRTTTGDRADEIEETHRLEATDASAGGDTRSKLYFWSFPGARANIQPWRLRLWELQNNWDRE
jgi:hypothetical protein